MSINTIVISGNLTRDPELRATAGGTSVLAVPLAYDERRKNPQTGAWEDAPQYVDCTVFGNRANGLAGCLAKGDKVCVKGRLHWSQWERDDERRTKHEIVVEEIELCGARKDKAAPAPAAAPAGEQGGWDGYMPYDIPF